MLVVRGTKKLRDRLKGAVAGAGDASSTVLGDWFASPVCWKPPEAAAVANSGAWPELKVTLKDTSPPAWRRLVVPASTKLDQLHEYIQAAFGWWKLPPL